MCATRIGVIIPVPNLNAAELGKRQAAYRECASKSTKLLITKTDGGPESTDSRYEEVLAGPHIISTAEQLARKALSALIVSCFGDPAVGALREIFDFPVVGPGEASILTASMLGGKFSIVTILENGIPMIEEQVRQIGLTERLASIRAINIKAKELELHIKRAESVAAEQAKHAIREDGASVLVVGCTSPLMALIADKLNRKLNVPVINPIRVAVRTAESLAGQGLRSSKRTYVPLLSKSHLAI